MRLSTIIQTPMKLNTMKRARKTKSYVHISVVSISAFMVIYLQWKIFLGFSKTISDDRRNAYKNYVPAPVERWILDNLNEELSGWKIRKPPPQGCPMWNNASHPLHPFLHAYSQDLEQHDRLVRSFKPLNDDLRDLMKNSRTTREKICARVSLGGMDGVKGLFPSGQLSYDSVFGYIEPLVPPMRSPRYCTENFAASHPGKGTNFRKPLVHQASLFFQDYIVNDFHHICTSRLHPTSRTVFLDMGASLMYHKTRVDGSLFTEKPPVFEILERYERFGIFFDHIYGFEVTPLPGSEAYSGIPRKYMASYHWINVGVSTDPGSKLNPLHSILTNFNEDDFVVVKLDIDNASLEGPLADQLRHNKTLSRLVDEFYFEHHVDMAEMTTSWLRAPTGGSLADTFHFFSDLRNNGVAAHFWV